MCIQFRVLTNLSVPVPGRYRNKYIGYGFCFFSTIVRENGDLFRHLSVTGNTERFNFFYFSFYTIICLICEIRLCARHEITEFLVTGEYVTYRSVMILSSGKVIVTKCTYKMLRPIFIFFFLILDAWICHPHSFIVTKACNKILPAFDKTRYNFSFFRFL